MRILLWIGVGIIALYLFLSFIFIHLSVDYQRKITKRREIIGSLVESHFSLLKLLMQEMEKAIGESLQVNIPELSSNTRQLLSEMGDVDQQLRDFLKLKKLKNDEVQNYLKAMEENEKLIRDEIYRHNHAVDNFNLICDSKIFKPSVLMLRLTKKEKY